MPKNAIEEVVHLEANFFGQKYDFLLPDLPPRHQSNKHRYWGLMTIPDGGGP